MADRIAVLDGGVLQQVGPPESVYGDPSNRFVADFLGNPAMNQLRATAERDGDRFVLVRDVGGQRLTLAALPDVDFDPTGRRELVVGLRPETLRIGETPDDAPDGSPVDGPDGNPVDGPEGNPVDAPDSGPVEGPDVNPDGGPTFEAEVAVTEYQGSDNFVHLRVGDTDLTAVVSPAVKPATGEVVTVSVAPEDVYLFDPDTGATLLATGVDRQVQTV